MSLARVSFKKGRASSPRISAPYTPGKHSRRFWTEEENAVLRKNFPKGGLAACGARLPERSRGAIYGQAHKLGLHAPGGYRQPIVVPAGLDDRLREEWPLLSGRSAVRDLAERLGMPRWWVSDRARKLGLSTAQKKEPPWTAAETDLMKRVPLYDPDRCAQIFRDHGFQRSPTAIVVRAKRLDLSRRATRPTLSGTQAAKILGVDNKTLTQWCVAGELAATRRGDNRTPQQGGSVWDIERATLRQYVIDQLHRIDIRKVDKVAFVHLLVGDDMFNGEEQHARDRDTP